MKKNVTFAGLLILLAFLSACRSKEYVIQGEGLVLSDSKYLRGQVEFPCFRILWVDPKEVGGTQKPAKVWRVYFPEGLPESLKGNPVLGVITLRYKAQDKWRKGEMPPIRAVDFKIKESGAH
jgi:hypothetical protein